MENFKALVQRRRSVRKFTDQDIEADDLQLILRAALMSPTGKNVRGWHFIVIDDPVMLEKISLCRPAGSQFLAGAKVAVVVLGDRNASDIWCEDTSSRRLGTRIGLVPGSQPLHGKRRALGQCAALPAALP